MINHCSLVLVSHTPSGLEGVPTVEVDFSIFKTVSHIHLHTTTDSLKNSMLISLRNSVNKTIKLEKCAVRHIIYCHLFSFAVQHLMYFVWLTVYKTSFSGSWRAARRLIMAPDNNPVCTSVSSKKQQATLRILQNLANWHSSTTDVLSIFGTQNQWDSLIKASSFASLLTDQASSRCCSGNLRLFPTCPHMNQLNTGNIFPMIHAAFPAPVLAFCYPTGNICLIPGHVSNRQCSVQQRRHCSPIKTQT